MVVCYEDIHLPVPDARCSATLAGLLGPCIYKVNKEATKLVSVDFLRLVAPRTFEVLGPHVTTLLAKTLL